MLAFVRDARRIRTQDLFAQRELRISFESEARFFPSRAALRVTASARGGHRLRRGNLTSLYFWLYLNWRPGRVTPGSAWLRYARCIREPIAMPLVGRHDLARLFEHTESYIHTLVKEGMPQASRGKYEVGTCLLWYIKHLKKKLKRRCVMSDEDTTERTARLRLMIAEAELRELQLSRERREFAAVAHFDKMLDYVFVTATTRFLALPSRIGPQLVGEDRLIIESRLERELKGALSSLSRNGFKNARKVVSEGSNGRNRKSDTSDCESRKV